MGAVENKLYSVGKMDFSFSNGDDLSIIVALEVVSLNNIQDPVINLIREDLVNDLKVEDIYGERWLLMYTIIANSFSSDVSLILRTQ